jgi:hypothetical protein
VKSFVRFATRELNFDPTRLLMFEARTAVPQRSLGTYRGSAVFEMTSPPSQALQRIYDRLRALPGAQSVGGISYPHTDSLILPMVDVTLEDGPSVCGANNRSDLRVAYFL